MGNPRLLQLKLPINMKGRLVPMMNGSYNSAQNMQNAQNGPYGGIYGNSPSNMSEAAPQQVSRRGFTTPVQQLFNSEEMRGSIQKILADNIGEYCIIEFLIGTEMIMRKQGVLFFVGTSYVTLYDDINNDYIVCDIFSVKFVYFYYPGQRPGSNYNMLPQSNN